MLEIYDFLGEYNLSLDALPGSSRGLIEEMIDLFYGIEGEIPRDRNIVHELYKRYRDRWERYLTTSKRARDSVMRAWWMEMARIRHNAPERYNLRHIRKDWYGMEEDPIFYSGKIFSLHASGTLGLKTVAEDLQDRFGKILTELIFGGVVNYGLLRLYPKEQFGVRDISGGEVPEGRTKACAGLVIATEKMISEEELIKFAETAGFAVRTSVAMKPSALSNYAIVEELQEQIGPETPIILVTICDYDYDGIRMTHLAYRTHFKYFWPRNVHHVMGGVFPNQVPSERRTPEDAFYKPSKKSIKNWLKAVESGDVPPELAPIEIGGEYYGIEMDALSIRNYFSRIVEGIKEWCPQKEWTDWAREYKFPDVEKVEYRVLGDQASKLPQHKQISSVKYQVQDERWRRVEEYDNVLSELREMLWEIKDIGRDKLEGVGEDIAETPGFDDRKRPEMDRLKSELTDLKDYEDYWDPDTKTGFSLKYLREKLGEEIKDRWGEERGEIESQVEEKKGEDIRDFKAEAIELLDEIRTISRVER